MGTWGTSIASNDTYLDIYGDFFLQYNKGKDVKEISKYLQNVNRETINENDSADCHNFWFALAMAQWETKALDLETLNKVKKIIETGDDLKQWKELGAGVTEIAKRQKALNNFLTKISLEKAKPRPRTKTKPPLFQKGDCVTFKLQNRNYGGVVILEACFDEENERSFISQQRLPIAMCVSRDVA